MCVASPFSVYLCCLSPVLFLFLWEKCLLSRPFVPFFLSIPFPASQWNSRHCCVRRQVVWTKITSYFSYKLATRTAARCRLPPLKVLSFNRFDHVVIVAQNFWNSWLSKSPLWSKMQGHRKINGGFAKLWPSSIPFHAQIAAAVEWGDSSSGRHFRTDDVRGKAIKFDGTQARVLAKTLAHKVKAAATAVTLRVYYGSWCWSWHEMFCSIHLSNQFVARVDRTDRSSCWWKSMGMSKHRMKSVRVSVTRLMKIWIEINRTLLAGWCRESKKVGHIVCSFISGAYIYVTMDIHSRHKVDNFRVVC